MLEESLLNGLYCYLIMQTKPARSMVLPRMVVTGPGVLEQIPAIIAELDIPERGLIVCDTNTLDIAGNQVIDYLEAGGHPMQKVEIKGANIDELERVEAFSENIDLFITKNLVISIYCKEGKCNHFISCITKGTQKVTCFRN